MRAPLKATVLLAVLVLASFSVASGQAVFVNTGEITGLTAEGKIPAGGTDLVIPVRFTNADNARTAISNGFNFLGDVNITGVTGAWNPAYPWNWELAFPAGCYPPVCYPFFDQGTFINYFTRGVGFAGLTGASGSGLPATFDGIAYHITVTGVSGEACQTLTMDSTWWEPANFWLWSGVAANVSWNGPHVFEVEGCEPCVPAAITTTPVTSGYAGDAYTYDVNADGTEPFGFELTVNPGFLAIDDNGVITGTLGAPGSYDVTVVVTNECGADEQSYVLTVNEPLTPPVFTSTPVTTGKEGVAYFYDANADGNPTPTYALSVFPAGMTIDVGTGEVNWAPVAGTHNVTVVATNSEASVEQPYVLTIEPADVAPVIVEIADQNAEVGDNYTYDVELSAGYPAPTFSLVASPAGMTIDPASGVINWTVDAAGDHTVTVAANNVAGTDEETFILSVATPCVPSQITSTPILDGQEGELYTYDVDATGDPAPTFSLDTYPVGMVIDPVTGVITWTPADGQAGSHGVKVRASNDCQGDDTQSFIVTVIPAYEIPVLEAIDDQFASVGDDFQYDADILQGYPIPEFSLVGAPAGMTINPVSGLIEWSVDAIGTFNITVVATNIVGTDEESFDITVTDCEPNTTCWPQPTRLKALENDRILNVIIHCERNDQVILSSIRVFNIPPYTGARIDGDSIVTDAFIMRFLGAGGMRPVPSEGYTDADYPVYYDKLDGTSVELHGEFNLTMNVGDVTFDGMKDIDDVVYMTEYLFNKGQIARIWGEEMPESMDVDQNDRFDLLDIRALLELTGL